MVIPLLDSKIRDWHMLDANQYLKVTNESLNHIYKLYILVPPLTTNFIGFV